MQEHGTIRVANELDWPPFDYYEFGRPKGFSIDYIKLLAEKSGFKIEFINGYSWAKLVELFRQRKIDVMPVFYKTKERMKYTLYSPPYYQGQLGIFSNDDGVLIQDVSDMKGHRVGIQKGHGAIGLIRDLAPDVGLVEVDSTDQLVRQLAIGKLDAIVGNPWLVMHKAMKHQVSTIHISGYIDQIKSESVEALFHVGVRNDMPVLHQIILKAMDAVTDDEIYRLESRWSGFVQTEKSDLSQKRIMQILSPEEIRFIKENPKLTLAGRITFDPFIIQNKDGSVSGIDADIAWLISDRTGLEIEFALGNWKEIQVEALDRKYDGLTTTMPSDSRLSHYNFTLPYLSLTSMVIVKKGNPLNIHSPGDLDGKRAALQDGNIGFEELLRKLAPGAAIVRYKDIHDLIRAVASGEADFTLLDDTAFYAANLIGLKGMISAAFPIGDPFEIVFSLRNDQPELVSIFNKALKDITEEEKIDIRNRWLGENAWNLANGEKFHFSEAEKQFLSNKRHLRLCALPDKMPLEGFDSENRLKGMVGDFKQIFEQGLGVDILALKCINSLENLTQGLCDLSFIMADPKGEPEGISVTSPILSFPYVLATSSGTLFVEDIGYRLDEKYTAVADDPVAEYLRNRYPEIKIELVDSLHEGLKKVQTGEVFAHLGPSVTVVHAIKNSFLAELKVAGEIDFNAQVVVATPEKEPILNHIAQKIVGSMDDETKRGIVNQWLAVNYTQSVDYSLVWKITAVTAVFVAVILFWNRKLAASRHETQLAMEALNATKDELEQKNYKLEELAVTDRLTGAYNRMKLDSVLKHEIDRAKRYGSALSIILTDIDHFKAVNDEFGHQVGDSILCSVVERMQEAVRKMDTVGRWGGEEFLIVCPETSLQDASVVAEKLRICIEEIRIQGDARVTSSFGVAEHVEGGDEDELIRRADKALYKAKKQGRNRVELG